MASEELARMLQVITEKLESLEKKKQKKVRRRRLGKVLGWIQLPIWCCKQLEN